MATILLAAAGAQIGAGFGGTVLGLSGAVIGRAVGATLGRVIDQSLLGAGSQAVSTGRIDRFRLTGASEGAALALAWGRMRLGGQVIWASPFRETRETERLGGGGKGGGGGGGTKVTRYSYAVSLAVAICEGEIRSIGRIWADGEELALQDLDIRIYSGSARQLPDPKIEAVEGAGRVPAYRGTAYVVIEELALERFGNRVPQFSFEVIRPAQLPASSGGALAIPDMAVPDMAAGLAGVALIPGSGEYALAVTRVHYDHGLGRKESANVHGLSGETDFAQALRQLREELPNCRSVLLVVSWFGDDLRAGECRLRPKVEQQAREGVPMAWRVAGLARGAAGVVAQIEGRPVYGGTPADAAVIEAIGAIRAAGLRVILYPFILMEPMAGNGLPDPWGGAEQPALPWRGRITLSVAPGRAGSPDRSAAAEAEVAAFFGSAAAADFAVGPGAVAYGGPDEWRYRRFILHCAALGAAAGGVEGFCIGSEMRGLTQIRGAGDSFPAVAALRALAGEVRALVGTETALGYAADWSEYSGYDDGAGNRYFHLDPLWADPEIDFVGIDNYLPAADWRDGADHADAHWGSVHDLGYLKANIGGGELHDWYYESAAHRAAQIRTPITDGAHGEAWVWRAKDIRGWWENAHHERLAGVRQEVPTDWVPRSKPVWFTEYGCAAVDKGANEPNKFLDPRSSESALPHFSNGRRDDLMQMQYLRAMQDYWTDPAHNPVSEVYGGRMLDWANCHAWCWDARPWPAFPAEGGTWADGANWTHGHWLTGRSGAQPLENVVAEICARSGLDAPDLAPDLAAVRGLVRGYVVAETASGRAALQPLMLASGLEAHEREGALRFALRDGQARLEVKAGEVAQRDPETGPVELVRGSAEELPDRVRLSYVEAMGAYETRMVEAVRAGSAGRVVAEAELALALSRAEAQAVVERWLGEVEVGRDTARLSLPMSMAGVGAGDVLRLVGAEGVPDAPYRIDRLELDEMLTLEAVRVEPQVYEPSDEVEEVVDAVPFLAPLPVLPLFLDLPLMSGEEVAHAPHLAVSAVPWPGSVACYSAVADAGYVLNLEQPLRAVVGVTETGLPRAAPGRWDRGPALRVRLAAGTLASAEVEAVLNGENLFAIGAGGATGWELFQACGAELVAEDVYALSLRLRGQAGTEAEMPEEWPAGSMVVRIDAGVAQIGLKLSELGLERHYRIGPAARGYDDPSYVHLRQAFPGTGLRPHAPCHLRWTPDGAGGGRLGWIRRTRINGDSWEQPEVPLGESAERYLLQVVVAGAVRRELVLGTAGWSYPAAERAADGAEAAFTLRVAQLSELHGAGVFGEIGIDG